MKQVIIIAFLIVSFLSSCNKDPLKGTIDETIYVRHQGADMPAYIHGNPENKIFLLAIHGAGSFGLSFRDENFIKKIEEDYVVVYFDNRAQSMSQGNFFTTDDIIGLMAEDVEALTEVIKKKYGSEITLFLMGHSLGGLITGKALLNSELQSQFNGWINVDGVFDMPSVYAWRFEMLNDVADEQISMGNSVAQWESIEERLNEIDHDDDEAYSKVFNLIVEAYDLVNKDSQVNSTTSAERIYQTVFKNNPLTWQISHLFHKPEVTARVEEYSILEQMYEISIPSLFTYGRYDFSVPPDSGRVAFNRLSTHNKVFSIYQRTTHHPFVTESSLFTQELREFIEAYR